MQLSDVIRIESNTLAVCVMANNETYSLDSHSSSGWLVIVPGASGRKSLVLNEEALALCTVCYLDNISLYLLSIQICTLCWCLCEIIRTRIISLLFKSTNKFKWIEATCLDLTQQIYYSQIYRPFVPFSSLQDKRGPVIRPVLKRPFLLTTFY